MRPNWSAPPEAPEPPDVHVEILQDSHQLPRHQSSLRISWLGRV